MEGGADGGRGEIGVSPTHLCDSRGISQPGEWDEATTNVQSIFWMRTSIFFVFPSLTPGMSPPPLNWGDGGRDPKNEFFLDQPPPFSLPSPPPPFSCLHPRVQARPVLTDLGTRLSPRER